MSACASEPTQITKTRTVPKYVPTYVPLPEELTDDCETPPFPERYTIQSSMDYIAALLAALEVCGADKAEIRALQPKPGLFDGFGSDAF